MVSISDEENRVILAEKFGSGMGNLGSQEQRHVLNRLCTLLDSSSPQHFIYETVEGCDELEVIRAGEYLRIYVRLVMGIPDGNKRYNILFVFFVDKHKYRSATLHHLDEAAEQRLEEITGLSSVPDVEDYLTEHNALAHEDVQERLER